jgi:hypothetical protein
MPVVEVFATGRLAQFGLAEAGREAPRLALCQRAGDQQAQALLATEGRAREQVPLLAERCDHARAFAGLQLVQCRVA